MNQAKLIFAVLCLTSALWAYSSEPLPVQRFEGGLSVGMNIPPYHYNGESPNGAMSFEINGRYNIPSTAWDLGISAGLSIISWDPEDEYQYTCCNSDSFLYQAITGHYNFRQGKTFNPYAGLGVGIAEIDFAATNSVTGFLMPEVGLEIGRHFRVNLSGMICRKGLNTMALSIGFVIGGRPKKSK